MAEQLARRSDYIATFSAHLTHELKSPLTSIKGAAELLQDSLQEKSGGLTRAEQKTFIANILADTERLEAMAQRLRKLARAESLPQNERTELGSVVGDLRSRFPGSQISATGSLDRPIGMSGEKALIVLSHLADNAIRHHARTIRLEAVDERTSLRLTVSNDGEPISQPNRDRDFQCFLYHPAGHGWYRDGLRHRTRSDGEPWGLVRLVPTDEGTTFQLQFPAA
jgi:signal transduction histidine kinase